MRIARLDSDRASARRDRTKVRGISKRPDRARAEVDRAQQGKWHPHPTGTTSHWRSRSLFERCARAQREPAKRI